MSELIFKEEVYQIMGAAFEVHKELGSGFLEAVYQESLEFELALRNIPFESQKTINIRYKNKILKKEFIVDLLCFDRIVLELKAIDELGNREHSQIINYLRAGQFKLGLLLNFGYGSELQWKRFVN